MWPRYRVKVTLKLRNDRLIFYVTMALSRRNMYLAGYSDNFRPEIVSLAGPVLWPSWPATVTIRKTRISHGFILFSYESIFDEINGHF